MSDEADIVAYVTGGMDETARLQFEQRLVADADLASRLRDYESTELIAAVAARTVAPSNSAERFGRRRATALAVLVAAGMIVALWLWRPGVAIACEPRLVASLAADDADLYARELGWSDPAGRVLMRRRGHPEDAALLPVDEFLAAVTPLETRRGADALARAFAPPVADFVTLRLRPNVACDAVVLRLDSSGVVRRVFPSAAAPVFGELTNPLAAGVLHTLPRPVLVENAIGGVSLHAGFEVAGEQSGRRSWFVVGLRLPAGAGAGWEELDAALAVTAPVPVDGADDPARDRAASSALRPLLALLEQHGFTVFAPMPAVPR